MCKKGFTLVEILVAIAIIVVLAALIVPALVGARKSGQKASCMSQLHQIQLALSMYVDNADGYYPPSLAGVSPYVAGPVFRCPRDERAEGLWCAMTLDIGVSKTCEPKTSYGYFFSELGPGSAVTLPHDDFAAVLVCLLHGTKQLQLGSLTIETGLVSRLYWDGSVHVDPLDELSPGGINLTKLFR